MLRKETILVVEDEIAILDLILPHNDQQFTLDEVFNIPSRFLKKNSSDVATQVQFLHTETHFDYLNQNDPIITQANKENIKFLDSNKKYNKLFSVFQRFSSKATQEGQETFAKILDIFIFLTESVEQNKVLGIYKKLFEIELPDLDLKNKIED